MVYQDILGASYFIISVLEMLSKSEDVRIQLRNIFNIQKTLDTLSRLY